MKLVTTTNGGVNTHSNGESGLMTLTDSLRFKDLMTEVSKKEQVTERLKLLQCLKKDALVKIARYDREMPELESFLATYVPETIGEAAHSMAIGRLIFEASNLIGVNKNITEVQIDFVVKWIEAEYPTYTLKEVAYVLRLGVTNSFGAVDFKFDVTTVSAWFKKHQAKKDEFYCEQRQFYAVAEKNMSHI